MKKTKYILLVSILVSLAQVLVSSPVAEAKDLQNRLGIGYKNQFTVDLPSVAAQYYPSKDFGMSAALGIQSGNDDSKFGFLVRGQKVIFPEDNLNFYAGAGAGLLSYKKSGNNQSGFEVQAFFGTEFFLAGLENLGFSVEAGFGVVSISSEVTFRTIAHSPLHAGITFYF